MKKLVGLVAVLLGLTLIAWSGRSVVARFFPMRHEGTVLRIGTFDKGGFSQREQGTRQIRQFAIVFDDGFQCEGTDTSFAAVREGDHIEIRGYHDVKGWPVLDPEWWECDEAQLVTVRPPEPR